MCYEIHGHAGKYFNLVSDTCTSVTALFTELASDPRRNRMSEIGIYAVSTRNTCAKIHISLENCAGNLNSETVTSIYQQNGISVRQYLNRWRVSVPNCDSTQSLIMWIFCDSEPDMLRFRIARGNNLAPTSHGLLGNTHKTHHFKCGYTASRQKGGICTVHSVYFMGCISCALGRTLMHVLIIIK